MATQALSIIFLLGFAFIILGFLLLLAYALGSAAQLQSKQNVSVGGVVMIGPIPIAFGNSSKSVIIAEALAIALILLAILFYFILKRL